MIFLIILSRLPSAQATLLPCSHLLSLTDYFISTLSTLHLQKVESCRSTNSTSWQYSATNIISHTRHIILPATNHLIQILTTLNLQQNQIGDEGAQYLANTLQCNQVEEALSLFVIYWLLFTDAHYVAPPKQ